MAPLPLWQHNKEEEEETGEREHQRHLCILVNSYQEQCHCDVLSSSSRQTQSETHHPNKPVRNRHQHTHSHTHNLKSLPNAPPLPPRPSLWFARSLFSAPVPYRHRAPIWIHYAQCQYWCNNGAPQDRYSLLNERARLSDSGRGETKRRGKQEGETSEIKEPHQLLLSVFPSPWRRRGGSGAVGWVTAGRPRLYAAAVHHSSIFSSVLPRRPVNTAKQLSVLIKVWKTEDRWKRSRHIGGEEEGKEERKKKKADESGDELFFSVAMATWQPELWRADSCHAAAGRRGWQLSVSGAEWGGTDRPMITLD